MVWVHKLGPDRRRAHEAVDRAPEGHEVCIRPPGRTLPQNDRMWALLRPISRQLVWHGQLYSPEQWKDFFAHHLIGGAWMPDEDGGDVPIGRSTSRLTKEQHSDLMALIEAFAARHGVDLGAAR